MENLKKFKNYPAVYWIALWRQDKKDKNKWTYPITVMEGNSTQIKDKKCKLTTPTYWKRVSKSLDIQYAAYYII